jgi:hypothetical protein
MEQLLGGYSARRATRCSTISPRICATGLVVPVLMGAATRTNGCAPAAQGARHEAPGVASTAKRLGVTGNEPLAYVLKTLSTGHAGKMSIARVLSGQIGDGVTLLSPEREAGRVSGTFKLLGQATEKRGPAGAGETVALGKLGIRQDRRHAIGRQAGPVRRSPKSRRIRRCWRFRSRRKSAKTTSSSVRPLHKLVDEDPSIHLVHNPETHEVVMWGQARCICVSQRRSSPVISASPSAPVGRRSATTRPSRNDPAARPAQEAVRRPRPVRRRGARHQAIAAERGLQVRGQDHRRRGAAAITFRRWRRASSTR